MLMQLVINALGFYITARIVPGITIANWETLAVVAVGWGLFTIILKPVLLILTFPVNVLTLGFFTFVINAGMLLILSSLVAGFEVAGFRAALFGAIILACLNVVLGGLKK